MLAGLTFLVLAIVIFVQTSKAPLEEDMYLYWRRSEPSECQPFTSYMIGCNKCICSADGAAYCTRMECNTKEEVRAKSEGKPNRHRRTKKIRVKADSSFSTRKIKAARLIDSDNEGFQG